MVTHNLMLVMIPNSCKHIYTCKFCIAPIYIYIYISLGHVPTFKRKGWPFDSWL